MAVTVPDARAGGVGDHPARPGQEHPRASLLALPKRPAVQRQPPGPRTVLGADEEPDPGGRREEGRPAKRLRLRGARLWKGQRRRNPREPDRSPQYRLERPLPERLPAGWNSPASGAISSRSAGILHQVSDPPRRPGLRPVWRERDHRSRGGNPRPTLGDLRESWPTSSEVATASLRPSWPPDGVLFQ